MGFGWLFFGISRLENGIRGDVVHVWKPDYDLPQPERSWDPVSEIWLLRVRLSEYVNEFRDDHGACPWSELPWDPVIYVPMGVRGLRVVRFRDDGIRNRDDGVVEGAGCQCMLL